MWDIALNCSGLEHFVEQPWNHRKNHAEHQSRGKAFYNESVDKPRAEHDNQGVDYEYKQAESKHGDGERQQFDNGLDESVEQCENQGYHQ